MKIEFAKAFIVQKFWSDKIFDLSDPKTWEMRSTITKQRGTVGVIEAGSGLIVGTVDIVACLQHPLENPELFLGQHKVEDLSLLDKWPYAWILSNAKRFEQPIPYTHPKGAVIWVNICK